jgi:hypothetical protein
MIFGSGVCGFRGRSLPSPFKLIATPKSEKHGTECRASAPLKAFEQKGASPFQGNVTALNPKEVTAFP